MGSLLPFYITRPQKRRKFYARLEHDHRAATRSGQTPRTSARLRKTRQVAVSQNWILQYYAENFERNLKKAGLRPDKHWYDNRADFAPPPPNPTTTAAAPKAKISAAKSAGQGLKATAEAVCGLLGGIAPLVPIYHSTNPSEFGPDKDQKYWRSADYG